MLISNECLNRWVRNLIHFKLSATCCFPIFFHTPPSTFIPYYCNLTCRIIQLLSHSLPSIMKATLRSGTLVILGFAANLAHAESVFQSLFRRHDPSLFELISDLLSSFESLCVSPLTVTVTVTSPSTETFVDAASSLAFGPSSSLESPASYGSVARGTSMEPTTTLSSTTYITSTKVLNPDDDPIALQSDAAQAGYYYFAEIDGTTTWLGNKTPTSGVFVTSTAVVTVQPQPSITTETTTIITTSQATLSVEDATSTSFTTFSTTSFSTYYHTKEVTLQSAQTSVPSAGLSSYGWNATLSRMQKIKTSAPVVPPSDINAQGHGFGTASSTASYATKRYHPRQIGAVVSATINGVAVSWTNSYGGEPAMSEPVSAIPASSSTLAPTSKSRQPIGS